MSGELHERQAILFDDDFLKILWKTTWRQNGRGQVVQVFISHTLYVLFLFAYFIQPLFRVNIIACNYYFLLLREFPTLGESRG